MSLVYAWEKLYLAMEALCGQGSQSERLINATTLGLIHIRPEDLPAELRGEYLQLMRDLTAVEADSDEGSIQATIKTLDASALEKAVRTVLIIFSAVCRHFTKY